MIEHRFPPEATIDESPCRDEAPDRVMEACPPCESSALDRRFDLSWISAEALAWAAVLLVAILVRFAGLANWPLSATEARIASDALALAQGGALSPDTAMRPLPVDLVALGIFLFGASDIVVRLIPVILGIGSILLLIPARAWLGRGPALGAAFALTLSPTLDFASRTVGAGSLLVMGSLLLLVALGRPASRQGFGSLIVVGAVGALLPLADPLGWLALPLALICAPAITGRWLPRPSAVPAVALGFLSTIIVFSTSIFTRPAGFSDFLHASLIVLWSSYLATAGAGWFLILIEVVLYELLPLLFGLYAIYLMRWNSRRLYVAAARLPRSVAAWTLLAGVVTAMLGGKGPELYCLVVLPLTLLGGIGLSAVCGAVEWRVLVHGRGAWYVLALLLTIAAAASAFGLLAGSPDTGSLLWSLTLLMILLLILIPLALVTLSLARGLRGRAGPISALVLVILLAAFGLRSSLLLAATDLDRPGELLLAGSTAPDVPLIVDRIQRLSLDLTASKADVRDPTGGHGLSVAVDRSIAEPFVWYLRDFPDVTIIEPAAQKTVPVSLQVIITRPEDAPALVPQNAGYVGRQYALAVPLAPAFDQPPSWTSMAEALINPRILKRYVDLLVHRETATSPPAPQFDLALRGELAARVYGKAAP